MGSTSPPVIAPKKARYANLVQEPLPNRGLPSFNVDDNERTGVSWKVERYLADLKNHPKSPSPCLDSDSDSSYSIDDESPLPRSYSDSKKNVQISNEFDRTLLQKTLNESSKEFVFVNNPSFLADITEELQEDLKEVRMKNMETTITDSHNLERESEPVPVAGPSSSLFMGPFTMMALANPATAAIMQRERPGEFETLAPYVLNGVMQSGLFKESGVSKAAGLPCVVM